MSHEPDRALPEEPKTNDEMLKRVRERTRQEVKKNAVSLSTDPRIAGGVALVAILGGLGIHEGVADGLVDALGPHFSPDALALMTYSGK